MSRRPSRERVSARRTLPRMDERSLRWEQRFEWPMVIAALLVIPLLVIEDANFGEPWDTIGVILNWGTCGPMALPCPEGIGRGSLSYCGGTTATTTVKSLTKPSSSKCCVQVKDSNPAFTP
jgi:hypothetical protein